MHTTLLISTHYATARQKVPHEKKRVQAHARAPATVYKPNDTRREHPQEGDTGREEMGYSPHSLSTKKLRLGAGGDPHTHGAHESCSCIFVV